MLYYRFTIFCAGAFSHTAKTHLHISLSLYFRDVHHLVSTLQRIFDTPSKKTLFSYVIPLLNPKHQEKCRTILGLSKHHKDRKVLYHHGMVTSSSSSSSSVLRLVQLTVNIYQIIPVYKTNFLFPSF